MHSVYGRTWASACAPTPSHLQSNRMYSLRLLDHFQNPRNVGDVEYADAIAEIENPACGDLIRLSMKVAGGRITEIGFKAKGCVPSMACASALTELVGGKSTAEAQALNIEQLMAEVGGLPQASAHAAQLAMDALSATLKQIKL
jgi:nitrogen fixation NifU-like protein